MNKEKYDVGRDSSCDICLTDVTVSRRHAILYPVQDCVKLEDEKSTVGTFINGGPTPGDRIPRDAHSFLRDDDVVLFGGKGNKWRLQKVDISVITTKLDPRDSIELKSLLRVLNGNQVSSEWSNSVTHLITPKIAFTPKLMLALVNCVPIVNLQFFRDAASYVKETNQLPDVNQYIPPVTDECPEVYNFSVNEARKKIFEGLSFIFLDGAKLHTFQKIIKNAGGTVSMWDKKKASMIRVASRVIGDSKGDLREHQEVSTYLLSKGRRLIPDSEIGLAIATVSIDKNCNPRYLPEIGHILAAETPYLQVCNSSDLVLVEDVPETIYVADEEEEQEGEVDKTKLRRGYVNRPPLSNTEVPETLPNTRSTPMSLLDDEDEEFNERSQLILSLVDQHSSVSSQRKRKHSSGSDSESPEMKRASSLVNLSASTLSQAESCPSQVGLSRFNSSQFIARPSQINPRPPIATPPVLASNAAKTKRTLADLLAKDDEDSEEELLNFKKKKNTKANEPTKKAVPPLLKSAVLTTDKSEVEAAVKPPPEVNPIRISQVTGWLSKSLKHGLTLTAESLDETKAWIRPLLNSIQVREIKVDFNNTTSTRNRTTNTTATTSNDSVLSGKRNFKSFKKQLIQRSSFDAEYTKTKSVALTDKL